MKKLTALLLSFLAISYSWGQRTPSHPVDIKDVGANLHTIIDAWEPGVAPGTVTEMDEQFYISRVRLMPRIEDGDYRIHETVSPDCKLFMWVPLDDPTTRWKGLPRYVFEGDNFSLWSYVDVHGNWTAPWMRVTAGMSDVAHKNGVEVGCVISIPWGQTVNETTEDAHSKTLHKLLTKDEKGNFVYTRKLLELMKYYGIDGLGINSEFRSNPQFMQDLIELFADCHEKGKEVGWDFQLQWYDGTNTAGRIMFDRGLSQHNKELFGDKDRIISDLMFANYNWTDSLLQVSVETAQSMGRNSYDYYAGMDIQKDGLAYDEWPALHKHPISIGIWGAHTQNLMHQSATDNGCSDLAIQNTYLEKQELIFSGGNRNPGLLPDMRVDCTLANHDLQTFHGLATFISAKSTLQQLPFVTRFSLGNGLFYNLEGKTISSNKWYNVGMQDYMPTWRFWITDRNDVVTNENINKLVKANLTFEDAWFGGSSLKLHGATEFSRVKLFKTKLATTPNSNFSITYKVQNGTAPKAKLFISKIGSLTDYKEVSLPAAATQNDWTTFIFPASELGLKMGDEVAMIGLTVENTSDDYGLLIGELSITEPTQNFNPIQPAIKEVELLRGRYNELDFKVRYASKEESGDMKTYNDEVDTWYYEVFIQQKGHDELYVTATPSWAAYVIGAPIIADGTNRNMRFGVRAVSPDGKKKSAISWTEYQEIPYNDPLETLVIDKSVIGINDPFTISFEDYMQKPAQKWVLKNALTNQVSATVENTASATFNLANEGQYDLYITDSNGKERVVKGYVLVTPLKNVAAEKKAVKKKSKRQEIEVASVSRGLAIKDPDMLKLDEQIGATDNYTLAFWFKADEWLHDRHGTNLINRRDFKATWPQNNWGTFWVHVWPKDAHEGVNAEVVSFTQHNQKKSPKFSESIHEGPNGICMANDFSVPADVWTHVAIAIGGGKQELWLNGKKVASIDIEFGGDNRKGNSGEHPFYTYIGGPNVYHTGLFGTIDDVQAWNKVLNEEEMLDAMKGYYGREIPQSLIGYWDFENAVIDEDGVVSSFENKGTGGDMKASVVKIINSGGEKTANASLESSKADNSVMGNPYLKGSFKIKK